MGVWGVRGLGLVLVFGFGVWVVGFGFGVLGFGFWVQGCGVWGFDLGSRIWGSRVPALGRLRGVYEPPCVPG